MADTPPPFDMKSAVPYTEDEAETPPPFDMNAAQPYQEPAGPDTNGIPMQGTPVTSAPAPQAPSREQEFYDATTGLSPENRALIEKLPSGKYLAPVANLAAQIGETALQTPQYVADKLDDLTGHPIANTALEVFMNHEMSGGNFHGIGDAANVALGRAVSTKGVESPQATPVPAAGHIAEAAQAAYDQGGKGAALKVFTDSGYTPEMVADQSAKIDAAEKSGPAKFVPEAPGLANEAAAFKPAAPETSPLEQEAAAFKPSTEPSVTDLFPTDESRAADVQGMTDKLQAEADAFKPADDTPPPFDPAAAEPVADDRDLSQAHALNDHINSLKQDWKNAPKHSIYPDVSDISDPVVKAGFEDPDVMGVYSNGRVHLLADRFDKPADATGVFYHEALAHHGLAQKFGADLDTHLQTWYDQNHGAFRADVDKWLEKNPDAYKGQNRVVRASEEVLAERTEKGKPLDPGLRSRIKQTIRTYARKAGLKLAYSDDEINTILGMAHQAVIDGKDSVRANDFRLPKFARADRLDSLGQDDTLDMGAKGIQDVRTFSTDDIRKATGPEEKNPHYETTPEGKLQATDEEALKALKEWRDAGGERRMDSGRLSTISDDEALKAAHTMGYEIADKYFPKAQVDWETTENAKFARRQRSDPSDEDARPVNRIGGVNIDRMRNVHDVEGVIEELLKSQPEPKSQPLSEVKSEAKTLNMTVAKGKNLRSVGDLARRVTALRDLHTNMLERAAELSDRLSKNFNDVDHANFLSHMAQTLVIDAKLREDRTAIARALNSFKIVSHSSKKAGQLLKELQENGGGLGALADKDNFLRFMRQVGDEQANGNPAGSIKLLQAMVKPYWWQYVLTGHNGAMLSGMATHVKNFADNAGLMSRDLMELGGAVIGGNVTPTEIAGRVHALGQGLLDMNAYQHIYHSIKDATNPIGHNSSKFTNGMAPAPVFGFSHVLAALEGADHFMKNLHMGMNLRGLGIREAQKAGLTGQAALQRGEYLAKNPSPEMLKTATEMSKRSLLQDTPSVFTGMISPAKSIRPGMSGWEQLGAFTGNMIFPFIRVADRLVARQVARSPLGVLPFFNAELKTALETGDKAARDKAYVGAMLGTAIIGYYAVQAWNGKNTGANTDYKKVDALSPSGYQPSSVDDGDRYTDSTAVGTEVNPLDLHNQTAANVASLIEAYKKGTNWVDTSKGLGAAVLGFMTNQTAINDITPVGDAVTEAVKGDPKGTASAFAAGQVSSFVPATLRWYNQTFNDTTKRDTTGNKGFVDRTKGQIEAAIPGLSSSLPAKADVLGQIEDTGKSTFGVSNFNMKSKDPTVLELTRIEKTQTKPIMTKATRAPWKVDGGTITPNPEQMSQYQQISGTLFKKAMDLAVADTGWKTAPLASKKEMIKQTLSDARKQAKQIMLDNGMVKPEDVIPTVDPDEGKQ